MSESQALFDKALANSDPATATRVLLCDLFVGHKMIPLAKPLEDMLLAIAELATAIRSTLAPSPQGAAAALALGDNWFQCPHCDDVFEGEQPACPACSKPLAVASPATEIALGDHGRIWLRASRAETRMPLSDLRYLASVLDWLRVEAGGRWFELFDEAGRAATASKLAAKLAMPPNVTPIGMFHDGTIVLAHATKLQLHEVKGGAIVALPHRTNCAPELVVRQIAAVLYPEGALPAEPDPKAVAAKGHARNAQLEAAIVADPDRPDAYLVYADWLQSHGDPRGELIVMQHRGKTVEGGQLIERHAAHFYGAAAPMRELLWGSKHHHGSDTAWRWGYLERLWIGQQDPDNDHAIDEVLAGLLDHPSCRFLRELTVGLVAFEDNSYDDIVKVIGARQLPTLHRLMLGDFISEETELNWSQLGDVSPLYRAVPDLRALTLRSYGIELGAIELPHLEELTIITGDLDAAALKSICNARWPALRTLSVQLGEHRFALDELAPIFSASELPRVTHLGLGNSSISDELCRGLAASRIAAQLEHLDLSAGTLGDDGVRALAAGRFPKLKTIDVSRNYITEAGLAMLGKLAPEVISDDQRDDDGDPEDRYIGARE